MIEREVRESERWRRVEKRSREDKRVESAWLFKVHGVFLRGLQDFRQILREFKHDYDGFRHPVGT